MSKDGKSGGWVTTKSLRSGKAGAEVTRANGRVMAQGSFSLPNGDRISTVRRDIMDRALGRVSEKEG